MKYTILILDLDGTTIPNKSDGKPSQKVINAIRKIIPQVYVTVATGRQYLICKDIIQELGIIHPFIVNGGSEIRDQNGKILWKQELHPNAITEIYAAINGSYSIQSDTLLDFKTAKQISDLQGAQSLWVGPIPNDTVDSVYKMLSTIPRINAHVAPSWDSSGSVIHVTDELASKKHAVQFLLTHENLDHTKIIAIGDSGNDIPLFEVAGFKVAMGNASESLKKRADWIAPTVEEDGVAATINKFFIPLN